MWFRILARNGVKMFDLSGDYPDRATARQDAIRTLDRKGVKAEISIAAPGRLLDVTPEMVADGLPESPGQDDDPRVRN